MKRNKTIIIVLLLVLTINIYLMYKSYNNKDIQLDNVSLKEKIKEMKGLAIMLEQSDGTYKESSTNTFPTDMKFNANKSGCIDNLGNRIEDSLTYENGTVIVETSNTSYCYLYFDEVGDIKINVTTNGVSGLPTINKYKVELTCNDATTTYSNKYHRIEFNTDISDSVNCNLNYVNDTNTYTYLIVEVESKGTKISSTNNNGNTDISYRYTGKQPNNWVWYNNELWRIIGSIPTCMDSSCTTQTNLVKIMRAESIGGLAYHSSNANTTWGSGNTLYTLLNTYYYGKQDATGASLCLGYSTDGYALCNYTYKGISNDSNDYYGRMVRSVYMNAGTVSTSTYIDGAYTLETATLTSSATKIGLMTASDYGYATSGITTSSQALSGLNSYEQNNWIYGGSAEWIMSPYTPAFVLYITTSGGFMYSSYTYIGHVIRPVIYLDSEVYIISGTGEKSNPYILGM